MSLKNKIFIYILLIFIYSCQPVEIIQPTEISYSNLNKFEINAKEISLKIKYNPIFSQENIEDQIKNSPLKIINNWHEQNFSHFGTENKLIIEIIEASIFKKEIENINAKKYEEKTIFKYEVFFLVEYNLLDDNNFLIANTTIESSRSTTSKKYISLNETDMIINDLLFNSLKDFTIEAHSLLSQYMSEYLK